MANDLVALIKAKQDQIAKLHAELAEARAALAREPRLVSATYIGRKPPSKGHLGATRPQGEGQTLAPDSAAYWAAQAIRAAGRPLHARDLVKAIEQDGHKVKLVTLVGSLSRWVKRRMVFYRAAKNTFGLIELRKG